MLSSKRDETMHIRSRLLFSQSSQATPSQALNNAFGQCNLADGSQLLSLEPRSSGDFPMSQSQCQPSQAEMWNVKAASQAGGLGSQDFITPAEQQFEAEPTNNGKKLRSPARLSPGKANKRHRSLMPIGSQSSQMSMCPPPLGRIPSKDVRRSPKCAHNAFVNDTDTETVSIGKRLPAISMYKEVFKELKKIGEGNFSRVYHVTNRMDGTDYAVKRSKTEVSDETLKRQWFQEIAALAASGSHAHIVRYYFAWMEDHDSGVHFYIQLERCGTSLEQRASVDPEPFQEAELLEILKQMASALQHLHERGIAHMDVKPDNIYTTEDGAFKLGDFGLATSLWNRRDLDVEEGDARYLPTEVLNGDHSRLDKADMFALGALLYRLATGQNLPESGEQYQNVRNGKLKLLPRLSTSFQSMMKRLMSKDPKDRPAPRDVLNDKLFNKKSNAYKALDLRPAD